VCCAEFDVFQHRPIKGLHKGGRTQRARTRSTATMEIESRPYGGEGRKGDIQAALQDELSSSELVWSVALAKGVDSSSRIPGYCIQYLGSQACYKGKPCSGTGYRYIESEVVHLCRCSSELGALSYFSGVAAWMALKQLWPRGVLVL